MPLLLCCALALFLPLQETVPIESVWEDVTLDNGIRVALIDAPDANSQVVFSLLPWGLLDDEKGQTQRSHLAEHILVHSADPTASRPEVDGVLRNGETMSLGMRLETFSELDSWREGLARHATWLSVAEGDSLTLSALLPRERSALGAEVLNTTTSGMTHKSAVAAWNQVVRHGAEQVSVGGDSASVSWDALLATMARRVHGGPGVQIVSVGPIDRAEQKQAIEELFGSLPARRWKSVPPSLSPAQIRTPGDRQATWELDRVQYMVWYLMPDESAMDRAAADALSAVVNTRLQKRGSLQVRKVQAFCSADLITAEGRWLLISASLPSDLPLDEATEIIDSVVAELKLMPEADYVIAEMVRQLSAWPDFTALRKRAAGNPGLRWIEASQALFMIYAQLNMGLHRDELLRAYDGLDRAVLEGLSANWVTPAQRSTLVLRPKS